MVAWQVPQHVFELLMSGYVQHEANWLLRDLRRQGGYQPGETVLHPGDGFGDVVAWLWETDPRSAIGLLADYLAQLRYWDELVDQDQPRVGPEDLLGWLPIALPGDFTHTDSLIARARTDVPVHFSDDINDTSSGQPDSDSGKVLRLRSADRRERPRTPPE